MKQISTIRRKVQKRLKACGTTHSQARVWFEVKGLGLNAKATKVTGSSKKHVRRGDVA